MFGDQAVVVWHWLQSKLLTGKVMWPVDGPVALVPLWQPLQFVMLVWSTFAGVHARVE